jgi:hypothetical protein
MQCRFIICLSVNFSAVPFFIDALMSQVLHLTKLTHISVICYLQALLLVLEHRILLGLRQLVKAHHHPVSVDLPSQKAQKVVRH